MNKGFVPLVVIVILIAVLAVGGYFVVKSRVAVAPIQSPTETGTTTPDATAGWKTYTNSTLRFSMNYPANWKVETDTQSYIAGPIVSFFPPNPEPMQSYLVISLDTRSFKDIEAVKEFYARTSLDSHFQSTTQEMTIGGQKAYAFLRSDLSTSREIYIFRNGKIYNLVSVKYNTPEILQMLSTLKFTDNPASATPISQNSCKVTGCSNQICVDANAKDFVTTCEMRAEYACYQKAKCERQTNGQCGFTITNEIRICLDNTKS